jgi:hypothetical protein
VTGTRTDIEDTISWLQGKRVQNPRTPRRGIGGGIEFFNETRALIIKFEFVHVLLLEMSRLTLPLIPEQKPHPQ